MSSFLKKLKGLLDSAKEKGVVGEQASASLIAMAEERERKQSLVSLTVVLGGLGALAACVGTILIVSANWRETPDALKIAGFLACLAGIHGAAFWIRFSGKPYPRSAEALHFLGAGILLAGVGLMVQIYHLSAHPSIYILLWFIGIAPLAYCLRSASITALSICALFTWVHMEGFYSGSWWRMHGNLASAILVNIGLGTALLGFSGVIRSREEMIAKVMRIAGAVVLFAAMYILGFFRHYSDLETDGNFALPIGAVLLGAGGLIAGWKHLATESAWLRDRLAVLLGLMMALALAAFAADCGALPRGPELEFFQFGWTQRFDLAEWLISGAAWALWFVLALWCVAFGARANRKDYMNAGVLGVGLGVITRFFDLVGTLKQTGMIFLLGGAVLLGTGWAMEKWRRSLAARMEAAQ